MEKSTIAVFIFTAIICIYSYDRIVRIRKRYGEISQIRQEYLDDVKRECLYDLSHKKVIWNRRLYRVKDGYCRIQELFDLGDSSYVLVFYRKEEKGNKIPVQIEVEEMSKEETNRFMERQSQHKLHRLRNFICKREDS